MSFLFLLVSIRIVTSTSDISLAVKAVAAGEIEVVNIIPGGICPGHFDLSPGEANLIFTADLVFYHGFETWFKKVEALRTGMKIIDLQTDGNWMIPDVYFEGASEIHNILKKEFGLGNSCIIEIDKNYKKLKADIDSLSMSVLKKSQPLKGVEVICNERQKDFLEFLGIKVVTVFSAGDEISLKEISDIVRIGNERNVKVVVDNLQSGQRVGETLAKELGGIYIILSNFPDERGYEKTLLDNVDVLLENLSDKDRKSQ
jgi:ABC-type Zn uptake system ZnuABC Zn-binding protein ZnuA